MSELTVKRMLAQAALRRLMKKAREQYEAMIPDEKKAMLKAQRESWVRGELGLIESDKDEGRN